MDALGYAAIALGGLVAGVVNTIVGAGTSIVLPLLILLGVDPLQANGTNRLCVAFQAAAAAGTLHGRTGATWRETLAPMASATLGALPGAWLATILEPERFETIVGWVLLASVPLLFIRRRRGARREPADDREPTTPRPRRPSPFALAVTFLIGVYGGFLGAGIGVLIMLYLPAVLGLSMVRMVHVKTWMVLSLSVASGLWYLAGGWFDGGVAAALLPSYALGGFVGARLALRAGEAWIRRGVALVAALLALSIIADLR